MVLALGGRKIGQRFLHHGQDRVIAATGAPTHILAGNEIVLDVVRFVLNQRGGVAHPATFFFPPQERDTKLKNGLAAGKIAAGDFNNLSDFEKGDRIIDISRFVV